MGRTARRASPSIHALYNARQPHYSAGCEMFVLRSVSRTPNCGYQRGSLGFLLYDLSTTQGAYGASSTVWRQSDAAFSRLQLHVILGAHGIQDASLILEGLAPAPLFSSDVAVLLQVLNCAVLLRGRSFVLEFPFFHYVKCWSSWLPFVPVQHHAGLRS